MWRVMEWEIALLAGRASRLEVPFQVPPTVDPLKYLATCLATNADQWKPPQ